VQAVLIDPKTGKPYGGADPRREGTVIGLPRPRNPCASAASSADSAPGVGR
jgi:hypothetical protein